MKFRIRLFLFFTIAIALLLSACGPQVDLFTREEQLVSTGLFEKHVLTGVSITDQTSGQFEGGMAGFVILAAAARGEITTSTNLTLKWEDANGSSFYTILPIGLIKTTPVVGMEQTQIVFDFKDSWLKNTPSYREAADSYSDSNYNQVYTEGTKLNPNNFILPENLDIVEIFINPDLLKPTNVNMP